MNAENTPCSALSAWFASLCNGDWEHHNGITIETTDNPGWLVKIALEGTPQENLKIKGKEGAMEWETEDFELFGYTSDPAGLSSLLAKLSEVLR